MRIIIKNADFEVYGVADISGLLTEVQNKFGGITDITPVEDFFRALGADGSNEFWSKIKALYMPCLGIPTDGANALYDIIGKSNYPGNNFTVESKRGVGPTTLGSNIGSASLPDGLDNSNLSYFLIVTQSSRQTLGSSSACLTSVGGLNNVWMNENLNVSDGNLTKAVTITGGFTTPQPLIVTSPVNSQRTVIASANVAGQTGVEKKSNTFYLSGIDAWADTALLAICDGITADDIQTIMPALQNFIRDYGIVSINI